MILLKCPKCGQRILPGECSHYYDGKNMNVSWKCRHCYHCIDTSFLWPKPIGGRHAWYPRGSHDQYCAKCGCCRESAGKGRTYTLKRIKYKHAPPCIKED